MKSAPTRSACGLLLRRIAIATSSYDTNRHGRGLVAEEGFEPPTHGLIPLLALETIDILGRALHRRCIQSECVLRPFAHRSVDVAHREPARQHLDRQVLNPKLMQRLCDELSADKIDRLLRKWLRRLPHPFPVRDRAAGYRYQLSILQAEFSLTQVLDQPVTGRIFFEEVIRENLDIGRPSQVSLVFDRKVNRRTPGPFRTRVITDGVVPFAARRLQEDPHQAIPQRLTGASNRNDDQRHPRLRHRPTHRKSRATAQDRLCSQPTSA